MLSEQVLHRPENFHALACRLIDLGYFIVPIPAGCKGPIVKDWQHLRMTKEQVPEMFPEPGMLIGILHVNNCFIDIDVYDPDLAEELAAEARKRFPGCLERVGQYPKTAIVLGLDEVGFKVQNTSRAEQEIDGKTLTAQVEIRTLTRQAVVYGTHPETGQLYKWVNGPELWETPVSDLPKPTKAEIQSYRDWAEQKIREWGGEPESNVISIGVFHKDSIKSDDRATEEQFLAALKYIPSNVEYNEWLQCLMAIHDFYGGSYAGLETAKQWSSDYPDYTAREVETKWKSFEVGKGVKYKTIFHFAKMNGADLSAIAKIGKPARTFDSPVTVSIPAGETPQERPAVITDLHIQSSSEFLSDLSPPVYVVDGVLAEKRCHSLTGFAGHGKTTLALHLAICVATGSNFADKECVKGACLVLAGENPDNVKWQYAAAIAAVDQKASDLAINFLPGHFQLSSHMDALRQKAAAIPDLKLIIIDSLQAFFEGENDNGNVEMVDAARRFRTLTDLPSKPSVIVIAHPAGKKPDKGNIVPRGGSGFGNEMDGNYTVWAEPDGTQTFHHSEKHRGAPFEPMAFVMEDREFDHLKDAKGNYLRLKVSRQQLLIEQANAAARSESRELDAIRIIDSNPKTTVRSLAEALRVSRSTAGRVMDTLKDEKLIRRHAKKWVLTTGGEEFRDGE